MARKSHARRYARAIFEIARDKNQLDRWQSDLGRISALYGDSDIRPILEAPRIRTEDKARLLREKLAGIEPLALNLVMLLTAKDRLRLIPDIIEEYADLLNTHRGIERADVITAIPLTEEEKNQIKASIKALTGKEILLRSEVDPELLGGVIIRYNDRLIDGSTRSRLKALRSQLVGVGR